MGGRALSAPVFLVARDRLVAGDTVVIDGAEGHHAAAVRRVAVGESVRVVDGAGLRVDGTVHALTRDTVTLTVTDRTQEAPPEPRLVVVQALAKGGRGERAVETMTEAGADEIVPWAAERSVTRVPVGVAIPRWEAKAREAAKQARRSWVPVVGPVVSSASVAERLSAAALAVVCHEAADATLAAVQVPSSGELVVVVGPEGGLTNAELAMFGRAGAAAYSLGPTVLRTSTAGVVAATLLLSRTSRWLRTG